MTSPPFFPGASDPPAPPPTLSADVADAEARLRPFAPPGARQDAEVDPGDRARGLREEHARPRVGSKLRPRICPGRPPARRRSDAGATREALDHSLSDALDVGAYTALSRAAIARTPPWLSAMAATGGHSPFLGGAEAGMERRASRLYTQLAASRRRTRGPPSSRAPATARRRSRTRATLRGTRRPRWRPRGRRPARPRDPPDETATASSSVVVLPPREARAASLRRQRLRREGRLGEVLEHLHHLPRLEVDDVDRPGRRRRRRGPSVGGEEQEMRARDAARGCPVSEASTPRPPTRRDEARTNAERACRSRR